MKQDSPFDPTTKSKAPPSNLKFRIVDRNDRDAITALMAIRNPQVDLTHISEKMDKELDLVETDPTYRLYVAELDGKVVGFCRYYHSSRLPDSKKVYPASEGWYGMGIMVDPTIRRQGIARFITLNRLKVLKESGVTEFYSIVDANNFTSLKMHRKFGFEEVGRAEGFLHIKLESSDGFLFKKLI